MRLVDRAGTEPAQAAAAPRDGDLRVRTERTVELDPIGTFVAARRRGLDASLWLQPDRGVAIVGAGTAWRVGAGGPDRFAAADLAWRSRVAEFRAGDPGADPLLLGGLGFSGRTPRDGDPWAPFGPAGLVLHAATWRTDAAGTAVSWATPGGRPDSALATLPVGPAGAGRAGTPDGASVRSPLAIVGERPDRPTWERLVGMFAGAVGRGRLDKVVLARRVDLAAGGAADGDAKRPLDVEAALRHLAATAPESTVYAFGRGGSEGPVFLGATPERLVRTVGRDFETVAIAGSAPRHPDPAEDAALAAGLLASEKDREEHAVVVGMLRESLAPLASALRVAPAPRLLELRHVRHLMTPVEGTLRDDAGLLALAGVLHPTPAVGGEPRDLALELIAEHEGFDRGWYAGPVGWVGADGDGELCVALRCGIVQGGRASLFAGCGIVADSDPAREWEESRVKLRALGTALGGIEEPRS